MPLSYLQIFADMEEMFEEYNDEERGRLFSALMAYCFHGEDTVFTGNERFVWAMLKKHVDRCASIADKRKESGAKGGRAKAKQTIANDSKIKQSEADDSKSKYIQEQEQEHEHEQEQEQEDVVGACAREDTAATAFDGSDLSESIKNNELADQLIRRYGLADKEPTREALLEDLEKHGFDALNAALQTAAESDTRGGISVRYWRAILNGTGKHATAKSSGIVGRKNGNSDQLARHEYTAADYRAMIVDLDEEDAF